MSKDVNVQFAKLINETFGPIIRDHGLSVLEESGNLIIAKKRDVELIFRLESAPLFYYFGLEVRVSGKLGEAATPDLSYRHLGVDAIAKCLDSSYRPYPKAAQTEKDLQEWLERDRKELFTKYCERVLLGDVSFWPKVVECLKERKRRRIENRKQ